MAEWRRQVKVLMCGSAEFFCGTRAWRQGERRICTMRGNCGLRWVAAAMIAGAGLVRSTASAQNVLANPGFEAGTAVGNGDFGGSPGWTSFGNTFTTSAPNPLPPGPHAGTGALKEFGTFPGVSGAFQDFPTTPGTIWQLTGFGLNASSDPMQPA